MNLKDKVATEWTKLSPITRGCINGIRNSGTGYLQDNKWFYIICVSKDWYCPLQMASGKRNYCQAKKYLKEL